MSIIFRVILVYCGLSLATAGALYEDVGQTLYEAAVIAAVNAKVLVRIGLWVAPLVIGVVLITGWRKWKERLVPLLFVGVATVFFHVGFSFFKGVIPKLVPYYADAGLADLDRWLHFGIDPWVFAQGMIPAEWGPKLVMFYLPIWLVPALTFPAILICIDSNRQRVWRYIMLYFGGWFILGNLAALAGSSVGPVFYDRLLGGERFADLALALEHSGIRNSAIGFVQDALWRRFETGEGPMGLGISAFPSMHVAIAAITAIYLYERSPWLAPVGLGFLAIILFASVYTGYHYALDGYFSIAAVLLGNRLLVRHQNRVSQARTMQSIAA